MIESLVYTTKLTTRQTKPPRLPDRCRFEHDKQGPSNRTKNMTGGPHDDETWQSGSATKIPK
jgi:hypothetical protein